MVVAKSIDVAGDELTECIVQYFRKKYNLIIGETDHRRGSENQPGLGVSVKKKRNPWK